MTRQRLTAYFLVLTGVLGVTPAVRAELKSLEVLRREPFAEGQVFGTTGAYEKIVGIARFAVDPNHVRNRLIVDLPLAPRNAEGLVEFESDFYILMPREPSKGNRAILYDVNNRGNKLALQSFNRAPRRNDPSTPADAGDGFLFRRGYTIVWCGWIGELLPGEGRLLMRAPIAQEKGQPIRGMVRYETSTNSPADSAPLSRREGHGSYPLSPRGEKEGVLTWRLRPDGERVPIPRSQWSLERRPIPPAASGGVPGTLPEIRLKVSGGLRPGYLYELIAEAEGPIVQGLGFAAVRDLVSFLRYDRSARNPLRTPQGEPVIQRAHAFGVSQSGRFLRNFLYLGFNADEANRRVFDGVMPHVAGGGLGFFNYRFAQPTRHNGQHEDHTYPTDHFPFTYGETVDPFLKRKEGILSRLAREPEFLPKIMHTQSAAEYWHRGGSLVHTDPLGIFDVEIPDNVRIYAFGGTQHGPASEPPERGIADNLNNPADYRPLLKALLDALDRWVRDGTPPPPSVYPRLDQGTLVEWDQVHSEFPSLPGVRYPEVIHQPLALDHGPQAWTHGILTEHPPRVLGEYVVLVPKSGPDGNDLGTLLVPDVAVPLATYTGWNLRRRDVGAEAMLANLLGSYFPFARTRQEREAAGDPRPSVEERYGSFEHYQRQYAAACAEMVKKGYLLQEDADRLIAERVKVRDRFGGR
ncbi:MAG: alpha/beta hydrolase domain-containing protein [Gemmataceae bacterium]|nr:alpha/beta hydrolase domain-containing protein [Gemmataceae bacterium]MDW8266746.1 alpha/beta hydrolase domain-containing protein [Gemmataceae bacterium]